MHSNNLQNCGSAALPVYILDRIVENQSASQLALRCSLLLRKKLQPNREAGHRRLEMNTVSNRSLSLPPPGDARQNHLVHLGLKKTTNDIDQPKPSTSKNSLRPRNPTKGPEHRRTKHGARTTPNPACPKARQTPKHLNRPPRT
jgi:hypothetical protein